MSGRYDNSRVKGMLHARGRKIVNGDGEEIILRGWGAGNWTNPEGFMVGIGEKYMGSCMSPELALPGRFQSGRTMTTVIRETCGTKYAREFWPRWHAAHLAEADIREMARLGYNSIRLPLTAWVLLPEEPEAEFDEAGFEMLTRVLDACEKYRIYAILDLHGAPGGQSGLW
ncbi:MAG: cellulase family glycosylhydrolase, partial [Eubacteriales bacterium]|nr:cellulase family glycosylhydrolase [Eubacteriales bacterium]